MSLTTDNLFGAPLRPPELALIVVRSQPTPYDPWEELQIIRVEAPNPSSLHWQPYAAFPELRSLYLANELTNNEHRHREIEVRYSQSEWGASGTSLAIIVTVADKVFTAATSWLLDRLVESKNSSDSGVDLESALYAARYQIAMRYPVSVDQIIANGEEELENGGWLTRFTGPDGTTYTVQVNPNGRTLVGRSKSASDSKLAPTPSSIRKI